MNLSKKMTKQSKLDKIKNEILTTRVVKKSSERDFVQDDHIKHYIRKYYWKTRIEKLKRDTDLKDGITYFSLCSKHAFDTRFFLKNQLINLLKDNCFGFCEYKKEDFKFIYDDYASKRFNGKFIGFHGKLADIALKPQSTSYGGFWKSFPFDVINLDYYGDIFKTDYNNILVNDFSTIRAIISNQARLRRQYELWITMRTKKNRIPGNIKQNFKGIVKHNISKNTNFKEAFFKKYEIDDVDGLKPEEIYYEGFLKWLHYVCLIEYSTINEIEILKYERQSRKDNDHYFIYNFLLRIEPYPNVIMPSPVGEAIEHCMSEYQRNILDGLKPPIDIDDEFKKLNQKEIKEIQNDLQILFQEYQADENGWLDPNEKD